MSMLSLHSINIIVNDLSDISFDFMFIIIGFIIISFKPELLSELPSLIPCYQRKQDRVKKLEEKQVYLQLNEAMEALLHICREGCRTIGPRDMVPKGSQVACAYPACKGVENMVRHFSSCETRVPGGCVQCKRMWQLLELHSRICNEPDACKVPLCRWEWNFRNSTVARFMLEISVQRFIHYMMMMYGFGFKFDLGISRKKCSNIARRMRLGGNCWWTKWKLQRNL